MRRAAAVIEDALDRWNPVVYFNRDKVRGMNSVICAPARQGCSTREDRAAPGAEPPEGMRWPDSSCNAGARLRVGRVGECRLETMARLLFSGGQRPLNSLAANAGRTTDADARAGTSPCAARLTQPDKSSAVGRRGVSDWPSRSSDEAPPRQAGADLRARPAEPGEEVLDVRER